MGMHKWSIVKTTPQAVVQMECLKCPMKKEKKPSSLSGNNKTDEVYEASNAGSLGVRHD